jgi:hypothetical protein
LVIEEANIVVHESHQPDFFADLPNADILTGEHRAQVDLAALMRSAADADPLLPLSPA